jgi:cob(I)alamin adenosyltransferase
MKNKRILVITGDGKGKTTASIGIIIRSLDYKNKIALFKFFKAGPSGEDKILKKLGVKIFKFNQAQFFNPKKIPDSVISETKKLWQKVLAESKKFDLIILDEINLALAAYIIRKEEFLELLENSPADLVCTGRAAPIWLKKLADTVSEIKNIKHSFNSGTSAQKGIEY